ncbi:uncharacterized protein [Epargyreus clarus]|uniref:uncharacterized protein n=1 Tax=Epargyreus clarus TaxID=520877 RepID=UPI003C2F6C69
MNKGNNTRAYPVSDANAIYKTNTTRASPRSDENLDKNKNSHLYINKIRLATWNLGSLTGRSQELSKILQRRNINICCLQETKWKGSKSKDIGNDYQVIYYGIDNRRNGVAIVLDNNFKTRIINITRKSDHLIAVKLALDNKQITNIISAYAPQMGCTESEREQFWEDFDDMIHNIPPNEYKIIGGDLNGHVSTENTVHRSAHGGFGVGEINKQGEEILNFASRHALTLINTNFQKKLEHLITYKCAGRTSQIDFIISDLAHKQKFKDCKVIPGEALTSQHRILVAIYKLPKPLKTMANKTSRTKWKDLNGPKGQLLCDVINEYLKADIELDYTCADDMWSKFEVHGRTKAVEILGISKGPLKNGRDPSWWNGTVKESLANKKELFKKWQMSHLDIDKDMYKDAKKHAKRCVASERARSNETFYHNLENAKTANDVLKIAKCRNRATMDMKGNKYIKSKDQKLLTDDTHIKERWFEYYKQLLNEEFPNEDPVPCKPTFGPIPEITTMEVRDMYNNVSTRVRSLAGLSKAFEVRVGVHQGSALSPLLFNLVMDFLTKDIPAPLPWTILYADDIVLADDSAQQLQDRLNTWTQALEKYGLRKPAGHSTPWRFVLEKTRQNASYEPKEGRLDRGGSLPCVWTSEDRMGLGELDREPVAHTPQNEFGRKPQDEPHADGVVGFEAWL